MCGTIVRVSLGYMIRLRLCVHVFVYVYTFSPVLSCLIPFLHVFCLFQSFYSSFHIFLSFSSVLSLSCIFLYDSYIFLLSDTFYSRLVRVFTVTRPLWTFLFYSFRYVFIRLLVFVRLSHLLSVLYVFPFLNPLSSVVTELNV